MPLTTPLLRNLSSLGEGATEVLALLDEGSSAGLDEGLGLEVAFLFRTGCEVGVCLDRGLVSVDACSLSKTGEMCGSVGIFGSLMGEPFDEDSISLITGDPCFMELLLFTNP